MNKRMRKHWKSSSDHGLKNIFRPVLWLFIAALLVLVAGCSSAADEQATADHLTAVAADQSAAATLEVEMVTATRQAVKLATSTADAATAAAEKKLVAQATAETEATVAAQATANAGATVAAQTTAEAEATIAAEATVAAQATAEAVAQATAEAVAQATAAFEATRAAVEAEKLALVDEAQNETPVVYLEESSLVHDDDGNPRAEVTGVNLRDFLVQTHFAFEPAETGLDNGDFGLEFRALNEEVTCLIINQDGTWQLMNDVADNSEILQEGETAGLNDGWNEMVLYVDGVQGFFILNGEFVEELDLKQTAEKGDIALVTGLGPGAESAQSSTEFKDFNVWSMDPVPPTPTPAPTSSAPQPPPPPAASGHTFPETPIRPFNRDEFVGYVGQLRDSFRSFNSEMTLMMQSGKYGDCGTFNGWVVFWIVQSPGYTNVPANFASLYNEYRSMLRQVVNITQEIRGLCAGEGGDVTAETIIAILDFLSWAYPRSEQMVSEASVLPGP